MQCIYEIRYEQQWESCEPSQWLERIVRVLADELSQILRVYAMNQIKSHPGTSAAVLNWRFWMGGVAFLNHHELS